LLESHLDDPRVRLRTIRILDVQEVAADKSWVAAMGFVYALVVVTEDVELAIDEASVRPGEIGERFFLSGLLDVSSGTLGEGLGLFGKWPRARASQP
jgi:hypothetical protein